MQVAYCMPPVSTANILRSLFLSGCPHLCSQATARAVCPYLHANNFHTVGRGTYLAPVARFSPIHAANNSRRLKSATAKQLEDIYPDRDRDEGIASDTIQLVDSATNTISEQDLTTTLANMDRRHFFLIQVSYSQGTKLPICKFVPKQEIHEVERKRQMAEHNADHTRKGNKVKKRSQGDMARTKIIEMGWGISKADLELRTLRLSEFLAKGIKVEISIRNKRRARVVEQDEANLVLRCVRSKIDSVDGRIVREEGAVGTILRILVEPSKTALSDAAQREARKEADKKTRKLGKRKPSRWNNWSVD